MRERVGQGHHQHPHRARHHARIALVLPFPGRRVRENCAEPNCVQRATTYQRDTQEGGEEGRVGDLVEVRALPVDHRGEQLHGALLVVGVGQVLVHAKEQRPRAAVPEPVCRVWLADSHQEPGQPRVGGAAMEGMGRVREERGEAERGLALVREVVLEQPRPRIGDVGSHHVHKQRPQHLPALLHSMRKP